MDKTELWKDTYLKKYFVENSKTCILVFPGGGYEFLSDILEGEEVAAWFNERGISVAVLYYRIAPYTAPCPLIDAKRAMRILRSEKCFEKIGVMGFSAGGHLAGTLSVHFENEENPADEIDRENAKPDFQILCYPVITTDSDFCHRGSVENLLGNKVCDEELLRYYSVEKNVTSSTPPAFIWHTAEDCCVPMKNSLVIAEALQKNGVPFEMHIYPFGEHGVAFKDIFHTKKWADDLEKWLFDIILK